MAVAKKNLSNILGLLFAGFAVFAGLMILLKLYTPLTNNRWFINEKTGVADIIDFFQYYQASDLAQSSNSKLIYDPNIQKSWADKLIAPVKSDKIFYNQQPPSSYVLLLPLSWMPVGPAYVAWCILQSIFGLSGTYALTRLGPLKPRDRLLFCFGVFVSFPAYICLWHGNTSFWLLGALSLFIAFIYNRRDWLSGIFLSISTFKPQYLFPLLMPITAMKRWKILIAFAAMELAMLGLASLIIGPENVIGYPNIVTHAESSERFIGVNAHKMISIRGPIANLADTSISLKATALVMFASLIPLFLVWKKATREISVGGLRWLWASTICTLVLVSPHSHLFDFLLLAMAAALTLPTLSIMNLSKTEPALALWCGIFILFPPLGWIANFTIGQEKAGFYFFFPLVASLFVLSLINLTRTLKARN